MDNDYQNFIDRMGSFEDDIDLSYDEVPINRNIITKNCSTLAHVGVLGMKWGHRKGVNANVIGKAAKASQDLASLGQTVNRNGFNKKMVTEAKRLSDDDLKQLTNRLNLENNYINARNQQSGKSRVEGLLSTAGSALAVASSAAVLYETIRKARG